MLRESSAPLVRHEERTDATDQADDSDDPEHDSAPEAKTHDQEDGARYEEAEADEVDWHGSLTLDTSAGRHVPQLGDWTGPMAALSLGSAQSDCGRSQLTALRLAMPPASRG